MPHRSRRAGRSWKKTQDGARSIDNDPGTCGLEAPTPAPAFVAATLRTSPPFLAAHGLDPAFEGSAAATLATVAPGRSREPPAAPDAAAAGSIEDPRSTGHRLPRWSPDVMVVSLVLAGRPQRGGDSVSPVRYELRGTSWKKKSPASRMVIDMGNTRYLSSRAVGVLLAHYQGTGTPGSASTMRVCGVSKEIKPVLDQMRLSMLIDVYPTVAEAVEDSWD